MKLGILCTMVNGFGRKGFYNTQEIGLGRALWRQGHEVVIYKCLMKGQKAENVEIEKNFNIHYLSVPTVGNAHGILSAKVLDKDLDGILCFADNQLFLPHIYRYCRKNDIIFVPYIGTTHSLYNNLKGKVSDFLLSIGSMQIYRRVPLLAKTRGAIGELEALGITDVTFAPVGLDDGVLHKGFREEDGKALRQTLGLEADDVVILYVARFDPEKRPVEMVEMLERIKEKKKFKLIMIGQGVMEEPVRRRIDELGLQDRVKLIDKVPYNEMWKLYRVSDYFVNLNRGEIFGMAIMEAVYYCTSVAASRAPGPQLTLAKMEGHKICDSDEETEQWLTAEYPSEQLLEKSSAKMIEEFSWKQTAEKFAALVQKQKNASVKHGKET